MVSQFINAEIFELFFNYFHVFSMLFVLFL